MEIDTNGEDHSLAGYIQRYRAAMLLLCCFFS
jgi:hypothetical protein